MDHASALLEQNRLLGELIRAADPATPVPTCPDWTLRRLGAHVGRGHRWAAQIVRERAGSSVDIRSVPDGRPPEDAGLAADWLAEGAELLLEAAAGGDTPVWTFVGPRPASWWVRRRLHEATVHRGDAALALGVPYELDAEVAADGVSEWLAQLSARPAGDPPPLAAGTILHLHATDDGLGAAGEWMIRAGDGAVAWEHGHGKGAVAVRGSAADLLLVMMRRLSVPDERIQVLGATEVLTTWLERTGF